MNKSKSRIVGWVSVIFAAALMQSSAQAGGCGDPRAQVCNPGQAFNISAGPSGSCYNCGGNTVGDGCSEFCSTCAPGEKPSADHSACVRPSAPQPPSNAQLQAEIAELKQQIATLSKQIVPASRLSILFNELNKCNSFGLQDATDLPTDVNTHVIVLGGCQLGP
jgi:hypothetical protein